MPIALKRYKDGSYTPLLKPWTRRMDYQKGPEDVKKKKKAPLRYEDWSQRDKMKATLDSMRERGVYSSGRRVGP